MFLTFKSVTLPLGIVKNNTLPHLLLYEGMCESQTFFSALGLVCCDQSWMQLFALWQIKINQMYQNKCSKAYLAVLNIHLSGQRLSRAQLLNKV